MPFFRPERTGHAIAKVHHSIGCLTPEIRQNRFQRQYVAMDIRNDCEFHRKCFLDLSGLLDLRRTDPAKVCLGEAGGAFQTIAKSAVNRDMGRPNKSNGY